MRVLKFIIDGQLIKKDPSCNFEGLIPGTIGYLVAEFSFSQEWNGTVRVAEFWSNGEECTPQILQNGTTCVIPSEALIGNMFKIKVLGKKENFKIVTDNVIVRQKG